MRIHSRLMLTTAMLIVAAPAMAQSPLSVTGLWASERSIFEIQREGDNLRGTVRALIHPHYLPEENTSKTGEPRVDDKNPDEALRTRPIIGLEMFSDYALRNGQWQGKLYTPESGSTYQSRLSVNDRGQLEIRGYIGMPMLGKTVTFEPVTSCLPHIVTMLASMDAAATCPQD